MTTHAICWRVDREDATVEGYTDHDRDLLIGGLTYKRSAGFVPSAVERQTDLTTDNQQVVGVLDESNLSAGDILNGIYDGARVTITLVDWSTLAVVSTLLVGHLGKVQIAGNRYTAELSSIEAELQKPIGRVVTLKCLYDFGDSDCGYVLTPDAGQVDSVSTAKRVFVDAALAQADDYYNGGKVTWTTGANAGRTMDVKRYVAVTDTVELFEPMPDDILPGDDYDIYQGCDKTMETCTATFSNGVNFGGFPYVPGRSNLISGNT